MTQTEALRLALEALEDLGMKHYENTGEVLYKNTYTAIKAALEAKDEPIQEPAAWISKHNVVYPLDAWHEVHPINELKPLYTTQPQRTWVGLTDEEASEIGQQSNRFDWLTDYSEAIVFVIEATTTKL